MSEEVKIVVIGAAATGKSSLTMQFVQGTHNEEYVPTIEDTYKKSAEVEGKASTLTIIDTAGLEEYRAMFDLYLDKGDGFLIVYNVLDASSFAEAKLMHEALVRRRSDMRWDTVSEGHHVPIVLVGNKVDQVGRKVQQVEREDAVNTAHSWRGKYYETSVKSRKGVEEAFHGLISTCMKLKRVAS
eukprot:TRINITY_DN27607_c0_g1_i1.p1 TRINITY_DN27607_c0_g1~~TRINITY_DN27607_c0_g1_i1.p1  ORF type:complete len:185 (+),score=70.46 TRINITY_DN27607_c0_g1_i1:118-672(+)